MVTMVYDRNNEVIDGVRKHSGVAQAGSYQVRKIKLPRSLNCSIKYVKVHL